MILHRKKIVLSTIFILFVFNIWQWWPSDDRADLKNKPLIAGWVSADDLRLFGHEVDSKDIRKVHRDLFVTHNEKINTSKAEKKPIRKKSKKITGKNNAGAFKKNKDKSGLNQFRLMAVLFKNGEKYAHLLKGDKEYSVKKGDEIEGRYLIEDVTISTVTLIEKNTHKSSIVTMQ